MAPNNPPEITPEMLQQNPVLAVCLALFLLLILGFIAGSIASWGFLGFRLYRHLPLLKVRAWSPRVWGLADVIITLIIMFSVQILFARLAIPLLGIDREALQKSGNTPLALSAVLAGSYLVSMVLSTIWIALRYQVWVSDIGFTFRFTGKMIFIGIVAGFATLPFIYLLSAAVSVGFETEYKHPILEAMKNEGALTSYVLAVFTAAIAAPFAEEFLFRVVLQGWLQSIPFSSLPSVILGASKSRRSNPNDSLFYHPATQWLTAESMYSLPPTSEDYADNNRSDQRAVMLDSSNPYQPPPSASYQATVSIVPKSQSSLSEGLDDGSHEAPDTAQQSLPPNTPSNVLPPIWPSIVTGILFGLAHWGYGLSFVPLIVLGIVLGLLYRATQSIWPCIVVHFMLNASSMIALGVSILIDKATP